MNESHRADFIAGLRALADYLVANPTMPVPSHGSDVLVFIEGTDSEQLAEVESLAASLGVRVGFDAHVSAERTFGPVAYRVVAIPAASRARHAAQWSYYGSVEPDSPTEGGDAE